MAFFENIGKKVGEAAQAAAKKSSELVEVTKLNMSISSEEEKMQKLYIKVGKKLYEEYSLNSELYPEFKEDCEAIMNHELAIQNLKEKMLEVKNVKICQGCGVEVERSIMFCPKCGNKFEHAEPEEPKQTSDVSCSCGAQIPAGTAFCSNCGAKISNMEQE